MYFKVRDWIWSFYIEKAIIKYHLLDYDIYHFEWGLDLYRDCRFAKEISKKKPIIWNGKSQMTGDEIHILRDIKTNELDSLKILNNAFIIEKDSLGINNFNQMKGIDLYGKFEKNELQKLKLNRNTEMIYYLYDEDTNELVGVDKAICSSIEMIINNNKIDEIIFFTHPEGKVYPEEDLEVNEQVLNGFNWRINEKILNKNEIIHN